MPDVPGSTDAPSLAQSSADVDKRRGWRHQLNDIRPGLWLAIALLVVAAVYAVSLEGEFVWDDTALLAGVERTLAAGSFWRIFIQPFWSTDELEVATRSYYRPLTTLTFAFDWLVHQRNSAGFRATNLFLHLLNTALLFQLCRRLNGRAWVAALLVTCWAIQPRLAESVAWISGRTDVLCGTFILAAFLRWRPTWTGRVSAGILLFLALLAKETAIAAVLVVVVFELSTGAAPCRKTLKSLAVLLAAAASYVLLRSLVMHDKHAQADALELLERPRVVFEALATYTWMLIDPWHPQTQIGSDMHSNPLAVAAGAALLLLGGYVLLRQHRRIPAYHWPWLVLAIVPLALVSHAIPISINVVAADRFLYLPTMALVLVALRFDYWSWRHSAVLPVILGISLLPVTLRRTPDWADPIALWTGACMQPSSRNGLALTELGNLEFEAGNLERARAIFFGLQRLPDLRDVAHERATTNLSITVVALGHYTEAQAMMESVVRDRPDIPKFWYDLATTQLRNGDFAAARRSLQESLRLMPDYAKAAAVLGSISELETAYHALHGEGLGAAERAILRTRLGFLHEAEGAWLTVLGAAPTPADSIQDLALAFVVEHGSARAVIQVLSIAETWQRRRPEILAALTSKRQAAERLGRISLKAYGIQP